MNDNRKSSRSKHYFGVECAKPEYYSKTGKLDGYVEIEIECLTKLHIGSGSYKKYGGSVLKTVMVYDEAPVIPGSSLKGCIRAVAAAVSHSCLQDIKVKNENNTDGSIHNEFRCTSKEKKMCIICSMFGAMGYASKVNFSECLPNGKCFIDTVQKKKPTQPYPVDKSRKFYKSDIKGSVPQSGSQKDSQDDFINVEAVREGSKFTGKLFFRGLTEEQLSLLMFTLGFDESFGLLLGGFRFDGLGKIKIVPVSYRYDLNKTPRELAVEYAAKTDCQKQLAQLRGNGLGS